MSKNFLNINLVLSLLTIFYPPLFLKQLYFYNSNCNSNCLVFSFSIFFKGSNMIVGLMLLSFIFNPLFLLALHLSVLLFQAAFFSLDFVYNSLKDYQTF